MVLVPGKACTLGTCSLESLIRDLGACCWLEYLMLTCGCMPTRSLAILQCLNNAACICCVALHCGRLSVYCTEHISYCTDGRVPRTRCENAQNCLLSRHVGDACQMTM